MSKMLAFISFILFFGAFFYSPDPSILPTSLRFLATLIALIHFMNDYFSTKFQRLFGKWSDVLVAINYAFVPICLYVLTQNPINFLVLVICSLVATLMTSAGLFVVLTLVSWALSLILLYFLSPHLFTVEILGSLSIIGFTCHLFVYIFGNTLRQYIEEPFRNLHGMATSIAHEVKTPIMTVGLECMNLRSSIQAQNPDESMKVIQRIERVLKNTTETIKLILLTSRDALHETEVSLLNLKEALNDIIESYPYRDGQMTCVEKNIHISNTLFIKGNEGLFKAVLHNLIKNAFESFPFSKSDKKIWITAESQEEEYGDSYVKITIKDNGSGIPYTLINKIFSPFVSTKETGTGLGLQFCRKTIQGMKGEIYCRSEPNEGTEFTILLPKIIKKS